MILKINKSYLIIIWFYNLLNQIDYNKKIDEILK
jgi:hypothetical protein